MAIYEKLMGNPFVDAGVSGICEWLGRSVQPEQITNADLEAVVEEFVPLAASWEKWTSIFTRNHALTNGKKGDRVPRFKKKLLGYIDKSDGLGQGGNCMGCGRRDVTPTSPLDRTGVPLTGGQNSNFFPAFAEGAGYCAACAFAIQFSPLALVSTGATGGRFLMLHSNSWQLIRAWTSICIKGVHRQYSQQGVAGCFKPDYSNPRNGLFRMVRELVIELEEMQADEEEEVSMQVYSFTNNNQYPDVEIFYIPSPVFRFLCDVEQNPFKDAWEGIVRSGYGPKIAWAKVKSEEDYKNKKNLVYEYLLQDRSIRGFFLNRRARESRGNWELLSRYLQEVRNMKQARLDKIKKVGDFIAESIRKSGSKRSKQLLRDLQDAETYAKCRSVLLRVIRDRIEQKEQEPLFSLDDYVEHLFISSDNAISWSDELDNGELDELDEDQKEQLLHSASDNVTFWRETRDLLLFRIYERLHGWLTEQEEN